MKTKLLSLFMVLAFTCSAQTFKFVSDNVNDMRTIADSIVSIAKRTYKYSSETAIKDSYVSKLIYVNIADTTDKLTVFYSKMMKGANSALELTGTPEYSFHTAYGKFSDLFPFCKKYIYPTADILTASHEMNEATLNGKRFYLRESPGQWEISMH